MKSYLVRFKMLSLLGIGISAYLLYHHVEVRGGFHQGESLCSISAAFDCELVARSSFAEVGGVPIAALGLLYYISTALLCFWLGKPRDGALTDDDRAAVLIAWTSVLLPVTVYFFSASWFFIGKFCLFCLLTYLINLLLLIVACRNPYRERGLGAAWMRGISVLLALFFGVGNILSVSGRERSNLWLGIAFAAVIVFGTPSLLYTYHFKPRQDLLEDEVSQRVFIEQWARSPMVEIPIEAGDLLTRDFVIGSTKAPLTVVEFSDFECPFCKRTFKYVDPVIREHLNDIRLVFKNYPLDKKCNRSMEKEGHLYACLAATMARCAGLQGEEKFFEMQSALFELMWMNDDTLAELVDSAALDHDKFEACMQSTDASNRVVQDIELGTRLDVQGTPTFYVNGKLLRAPPEVLPTLLVRMARDARNGTLGKFK